VVPATVPVLVVPVWDTVVPVPARVRVNPAMVPVWAGVVPATVPVLVVPVWDTVVLVPARVRVNPAMAMVPARWVVRARVVLAWGVVVPATVTDSRDTSGRAADTRHSSNIIKYQA